MNARAYTYEGLDFDQNDFQPPRKNRFWEIFWDMTERLGQRYAEAEMIRRERYQLDCMDDRQLADIGLSRYDVQAQYKSSFLDLGDIRR